MRGKQVSLGVYGAEQEPAAVAAFQQLLATIATQQQTQAGRFGTLAELVAAYLADCGERVKPETLKGYRWYLDRFVARYGTLPPAGLDPAAVEADARRRKWTDTTRAHYLATVEQALRWAGVRVRLRKPPKASAGADSVIPERVYLMTLGAARRDFRALVEFLWLVGCRPSEATSLTAEMIDFAGGVVRLKHHKTERHGKQRVLYLPAAAVEVLKRQAKKYDGRGLLFRDYRGRPFSRMGLVKRFLTVSKRIGHRVTAYGFRHSFATRALERGVPDTHVAALLGQANTAMLHRHYSHLTANARLLRDVAERVAAELPDKPGAA